MAAVQVVRRADEHGIQVLFQQDGGTVRCQNVLSVCGPTFLQNLGADVAYGRNARPVARFVGVGRQAASATGSNHADSQILHDADLRWRPPLRASRCCAADMGVTDAGLLTRGLGRNDSVGVCWGTVSISLILVREATDDGNGHAVPSTIKSVGTEYGGIQMSRPVDSKRILKINESETVPSVGGICGPVRTVPL